MPNELNANAQKWVDALRSGEYEKCQAMLHEFGGIAGETPMFCVLGVACDLYAKANPDHGRWDTDSSFVTASGAKMAGLPIEVSDWLGLTRLGDNDERSNEYGQFLSNKYIPDTIKETLAWLNDEGDITFAQIAHVIESQPEGLFDA